MRQGGGEINETHNRFFSLRIFQKKKKKIKSFKKTKIHKNKFYMWQVLVLRPKLGYTRGK